MIGLVHEIKLSFAMLVVIASREQTSEGETIYNALFDNRTETI